MIGQYQISKHLFILISFPYEKWKHLYFTPFVQRMSIFNALDQIFSFIPSIEVCPN